MTIRHQLDTLPSGLRVVTVEAQHLHTALLSVYVYVGSRHETSATNGVSHLLEHLIFRGSAGLPNTRLMNAAVEKVGGNLNGVTTRDHSFYFTPVHPDGLGVAFDVLGDLLLRPKLSHLEIEREIILEEMLDEVDEHGRDIDTDNLTKGVLFGAHPLGLKIAGTPTTVKTLSLPEVKAHLAQFYVSQNIVVAAAGAVAHGEVVERAKRAFARLPIGPRASVRPAPLPPSGPWFRHVPHDEPQIELKIVFPAVPEQHPDFPALLLIRRLLDDGLSSRLPYEIVERRGLAYSLSAGIETYEDTGLFDIEAATTPSKAPELLERVFGTLGGLRRRLVAEDELKMSQHRHRLQLTFAHDSPGELAGWFGATELFHRAESFEQRCRRVEAVTPAELRDVARRTFSRRGLGVVAVGPSRGVMKLRQAALAAKGLGR